MVLAQIQTQGLIEQSRRPRYESSQLHHLIFDKGTQNLWWRKNNLFDKCFWEYWISACRKLKLGPYLSPCASIKSKWIKDLIVRLEILKLIQERTGNTLELLGMGNSFLNRTQVAQQLRETIDKWNYMKLKSFCQTKEKWSPDWRGSPENRRTSLPAMHLTRD
jgi:hypothetical protein